MTGITNSKSTQVTVIGLGSMGAAIARALLAKGLQVTVWNRDTAKAAPLLAQGAVMAPGIVEAVTASPLLVVCVSDYKATKKIFDTAGAAAALKGRTLVQLSTGTPKEARELEAWAQQQGAVSLNGDILAWPKQIGSSEATISLSGAGPVSVRNCRNLRPAFSSEQWMRVMVEKNMLPLLKCCENKNNGNEYAQLSQHLAGLTAPIFVIPGETGTE